MSSSKGRELVSKLWAMHNSKVGGAGRVGGRMPKVRPILALLVLALGAQAQDKAAAPREGIEFFEKRIRPILSDRCYKCHSGDKVKADLWLDSREAMLKGGETGPAVVPGDPDKSLLIQAIRHGDDDLDMPPKQADWLTPEQIRDFE